MSNITNNNEITNTINNEPLINTNNYYEITNSDNQNNDKFLLYFDNKIKICILIIILLIFLVLLIPIFIFVPILAIAILFMLYLTIIMIFLGLSRRYVRLTKNVDKNELQISNINYLECALNTLQLKCDTTNFIVKFTERQEDYYSTYFTKIFIMKNFKNFDEIDIDKSNIINEPIIFYYQIEGINMQLYDNFDELENQLNNFINSPADNDKLNQIIENRCKKLSEHFYSYGIKCSESNFCGFLFIFLVLTFVYWIFAIISLYQFIKEKNVLIWIGFIGGYLFCLLLFFILVNYTHNKIMRIDFIFSKNFDRIFIGNVRQNGESYRDKFILEMNRINIFFLDKKRNNTALLRVIESNNYIDILEITEKNFEQLEKLVNLLNRKLRNNNNNNNIQQISEAILPNN